MIVYRPTDGEAHTVPVIARCRTCFLMTQLGGTIPPTVVEIRRQIEETFVEADFAVVDADSFTTGRDFLLKIWEVIVSVPVGVAIVHEGVRPATLANIYYELGLMQALGKETLVVKAPGAQVPSDFVRTEYVTADGHLQRRLGAFIESLRAREAHYGLVGTLVENNPLLALDYLRRAYLLFGEAEWQREAAALVASTDLSDRATDSVEMILASFAR